MVAEVIVDISTAEVDKIFDYTVPDDMPAEPGCRVTVPFGRSVTEGFIIALKEKSDYGKPLKPISSLIDEFPAVELPLLKLMDFMTEKYHLRRVDVLRLFLPAEMRRGRIKPLNISYASLSSEYRDKAPEDFIKKNAAAQAELFEYLKTGERFAVTELNRAFSASALRNFILRGVVDIIEERKSRKPYADGESGGETVVLTQDQQKAVEQIGKGGVTLLHGVTGSGKTEVYMHCIERALKAGKTAIMLVPEISLTPQVMGLFRGRFGERAALLHSGLSAGERYDEWCRLKNGDAVVAVGARSAIFAPLTNLGIIIIDEEHDGSYQSESNPRYFTHEVAAYRAETEGCPLVLGSATPSIETYYKATTNEYRLVELLWRINERPLPEIEIVNMCKEVYDGNNGVFSRALLAALTDCIERGEQAMIFINRRGYSSFIRCPSCGYIAKCVDCDVSLVFHKDEKLLKCHYCGNRYPTLTVCPECKSEHIRQGYVGTQQVVEKLQELFPKTKILRMDNDTTRSKDAHAKILSAFSKGKASILVGTQMIAKGHDFPEVTLVGIVDADLSLHFADYRSFERTYQLVTQVSGRAGRDKKPGRVVLQTYSPNHYVYRYAAHNDFKGFFDKECNLREVTKYPPFSRIVRVLVTAADESLAGSVLKGIFDELTPIVEQNRESVAYFAAMKSPVKRVKNAFRVQILMRLSADFDKLTAIVYNTVDRFMVKNVTCFVEINPNSLY